LKRFSEYLTEESFKISISQLKQLEKVLDELFGEIGVDIEFTRHFFDRLNDPRNVDQVTLRELRDMFRKEFLKYKDAFKNIKPNTEAMLKDVSSQINMPFAIEFDRKNNELDFVFKTMMRKKDFKTRTKVYKVT